MPFLSDSEVNQLFALCQQTKNEVKNFIHVSSNLPNLKNPPLHRSVWLHASRAPNDDNHTRQKLLKQLHINIFKPSVSNEFKKYKPQHIKLPEKVENMEDLLTYFGDLQENAFKKTHHKNQTHYLYIHELENIAKNAVKFGIGNCHEKAALSFILLHQLSKENLQKYNIFAKTTISIEFVALSKNGDHCFVLVNRDLRTNLNDIHSWNADTIILDSWINEVLLVGDRESLYESNWYKWVKKFEHEIGANHYYNNYVANGPSKHWVSQRDKHNQPVKLKDWPRYTNDFFPKPKKGLSDEENKNMQSLSPGHHL